MRFACLLLILAVPGCDDGARVPLQRVTQERDDLAAKVDRQAEQIRDLETQLRNMRQQFAVMANTPVNQPTRNTPAPAANNDPGDPFGGDFPTTPLPLASELIKQAQKIADDSCAASKNADELLTRLRADLDSWLSELVRFHGEDERVSGIVAPAVLSAWSKMDAYYDSISKVRRVPIASIEIEKRDVALFVVELNQIITSGAITWRRRTGKSW